MQQLRITRKFVSEEEARNAIATVAAEIFSFLNPVDLYLVGTAATAELTDQSDLDFVIIMENKEQVQQARRKLGTIRGDSKFPLDLIVVDQTEFDIKSRVGGICMIAVEEGKRILRDELND